VRVSEAPALLAAAETGRGVTEVSKSLKPQRVSLRADDEPALPAGMSFAVPAPEREGMAAPAETRLPLPDADIGPLALREAAAAGNAGAQYLVGLRFAQGAGSAGKPNWTEAARWFALAASAGLAPAQYRLAVLYERGEGVAKDLGMAKSWYQRAAEQGNVKAMHNLAVAVSRESESADYALAAKWYREAAAYGLADSQFNLGVLAEHGLGMQKDLAEAYRWFALAAATRDPEAIKRRDALKAALSIVGAAEADAAIGTWKPKPAKPEANEVPEQDLWRDAPEPASKDLVARAQTLLNALGYQAGPADGEAGMRTREAIKAFELRNGMDQTGEVTAPLLSKLQHLAG
jgi:localization factor PodJL